MALQFQSSACLRDEKTEGIKKKKVINDLDGTKHILRKFADDIELLRVVDTPHGCFVIWKNLKRLERWATRILIEFDTRKYESLHKVSSNSICPYKLEATWLVIQRSGRENPNSTMYAVKQIFFIAVPGTWGISPPHMRTRHRVTSG